jgi:lipoprotein NlpD
VIPGICGYTRRLSWLWPGLWLLLLLGCGHNPATVQVVERSAGQLNKSGAYVVQPGDSLYSIAWNYGLDFRGLARANGLQSPYLIYPGDRLRLQSASPVRRAAPATSAARPEPPPRATDGLPKSNVEAWLWPVSGSVLRSYSDSGKVHKGIDIQGKSGQPVTVAKSGKVVYAGRGLEAYGLLIIVKHDAHYLSAYAYNKSASVREGDSVKRGQQIAQMGTKDGKAMLHFEIRRDGKTVDPRILLPRR